MTRKMKSVLAVILTCFMFLFTACNIADSGDLLFLKGVEAYNDGDYASAIESLETAVEVGLKRYEIGDLYSYLGHCYSELNMYGNAIDCYQTALSDGPEKVEYVVNLAIAYRRSGDNQKALELYLQALEIDPDDAELNSSLGSLFILENEPEKAVRYFDKAIEQDPSLAVAYGNGALAYALIGDFETAYDYLEKAEVRGYTNADTIRERIEALKE